MFKKIEKRDGKIANFKPEKIAEAIEKAGLATGEFKADRAKALSEKALKRAEETIKQRVPSVEQIQDIVEQVLMESSFKKTAKAYIAYRLFNFLELWALFIKFRKFWSSLSFFFILNFLIL